MKYSSSARTHYLMLAGVLLLIALLPACQLNSPTVVSPVMVQVDGTPLATATYWRDAMPPTWTPLPTESIYRPTPTPWPMSTVNARLTLVAGTTQAPGYGCKKHPDAWKVFVNRAWDPDWCEVRGGWTSFYEYKLFYPQGWTVNVFGEYYPNLAWNVGQPNIDLRLYQVFSYDVRSFTGTLEEAPEKAAQCDPSDKCEAIVNPKETFISKEVRELPNRDMLVLDTEYGDLLIRRYFLFVPFNPGQRSEERLFVFELSALKSYIEGEKYNQLIQQVDQMVPTLMQR